MEFLGLLTISDTLSTIWDRFAGAVMSFNSFKDVIDVLFVAVLIYTLIVQMRRSQSMQITKGIVLVAALYGVVNIFEMNASKYLFSEFFSNLLVILVIIFSGEIRQALERMGQRNRLPWTSLFSSKKNDEDMYDVINNVCRACAEMSEDKVGSLIVFQRRSLLGDITRQSVPIDSCVTTEMLLSIFFPKAALHDGAIVIRDDRIVAARCVVPLKNEKEVTEHVGTRHRAALEVSLRSDAVAVVTSEETGIISVACAGKLIRGLSDAELREMLVNLLVSEPSENGDRKKSKKKKGDKSK
ncbi:MAG: diadenylate cyclase CdaA [Clostridia bacterium]|nr:diadenylate cyclase CdaA [Clostridia bacterium]